jgi:hypothetical protein
MTMRRVVRLGRLATAIERWHRSEPRARRHGRPRHTGDDRAAALVLAACRGVMCSRDSGLMKIV